MKFLKESVHKEKGLFSSLFWKVRSKVRLWASGERPDNNDKECLGEQTACIASQERRARGGQISVLLGVSLLLHLTS